MSTMDQNPFEKALQAEPVSRTSRRDRRQSQEPRRFNRNTGLKTNAVALSAAGILLTGGGFAGGWLANNQAEPETPFPAPVTALTTNMGFSPYNAPEGWTDNSKTLSDANPQESARNPLPIEQGKCSFVRSIAFAPAGYAGRGSEYLSLDRLYGIADRESADIDGTPALDTVKVAGEATDAWTAGWNTEDNGYKKTAVRVFDGLVEVPEDTDTVSAYGETTTSGEGLPVVVLTYSCTDKSEYSQETWDMLLDTVDISPVVEADIPETTDGEGE